MPVSIRDAFRRDQWWVGANGLGAIAYLRFASQTWIEPELRGENVGRAGDALIWGITCLPIAAVFLVVDLIWLTGRTRSTAPKERWPSLLPVLAIGAGWFAVLAVDALLR